PMINTLLGVRVMLNDLDPGAAISEGNGLMAVHVDKPEMFVGMASMMIPGFENLDLANQKEPVRIPPEMTYVEGLDVFALMGKNAIGLSFGEQHVKDLEGFMGAESQDDGTLLSVSYDMGKQMEIQAALAERFLVESDGEQSVVEEYSEAVEQVYTDMLDRSRINVRLNPDGLHIDTDLTFK
ncbi:MAG TPA: hypothetical protein VIS57_06875, partial [Xanthomonadales bacterium]